MKTLRVLIFGISNNYGGLETFIHSLYINMDHKKIIFDFIDNTPEGEHIPFYEEYLKTGSKIFKIHKRSENWRESNKDIENIFIENEFDFVHFNIMNYCWWNPIIIANKYSKAKIILHSHNSKLDQKSFIKNKILDTIGRLKTRNINYLRLACGNDAGKYLFKGKEFNIIENGINVDKFKFNLNFRKKIRKEFNINDSCTLIGHVGNFYIAKNYPKLIDLFFNYLKYDSSAKLMLVGNNLHDKSVEEKVKELGIEKNVIFTGIRKDTNMLYSAFDLFLFPSLYEGLSISMIEAQISGLKCYASNKIDPTTSISKNVQWIDINESSDKLAKLIYDDNLKNKIDRNNVVFDKAYDVNNAALKLQNYYLKEYCRSENTISNTKD